MRVESEAAWKYIYMDMITVNSPLYIKVIQLKLDESTYMVSVNQVTLIGFTTDRILLS